MTDTPDHIFILYIDEPHISFGHIEPIVRDLDLGVGWEVSKAYEKSSNRIELKHSTSGALVEIAAGTSEFGDESFPSATLSGDSRGLIDDAALLVARKLQRDCEVDNIGASVLRLVGQQYVPHGSGLLEKDADAFDIDLPWEPNRRQRRWRFWNVALIAIVGFVGYQVLTSDDSEPERRAQEQTVVNLATADVPECSLFRDDEVIPVAFRLNDGDLSATGITCVNGSQRFFAERIQCPNSDGTILAHDVGWLFEYDLVFHFGPPPRDC